MTDANDLVATPVDVPILVYEIGVVEGQVGAAVAAAWHVLHGCRGVRWPVLQTGVPWKVEMSGEAVLPCLLHEHLTSQHVLTVRCHLLSGAAGWGKEWN